MNFLGRYYELLAWNYSGGGGGVFLGGIIWGSMNFIGRYYLGWYYECLGAVLFRAVSNL